MNLQVVVMQALHKSFLSMRDFLPWMIPLVTSAITFLQLTSSEGAVEIRNSEFSQLTSNEGAVMIRSDAHDYRLSWPGVDSCRKYAVFLM